MIAVLGALKDEIYWFLKEMEVKAADTYNGIDVYSGYLNGLECVVTWSGVGKVFAAAATQFVIDNYRPDILFFVGIAGGIGGGLNIGDVVLGESVMMHDVDLSFFGYERGELPLPASGGSSGKPETVRIIECDKGLLSSASSWKYKGFALKRGLVITGDSFIHRSNTPGYIVATGGIAVDMEGAASALVCRRSGIPFMLARVVSDTPDGSVKTGFRKFLASSSRKLYSLVIHIIAEQKGDGGA